MFALLEHVTREGVHWDLLIQTATAEKLLTWRLAQDPTVRPLPIAAERIADHRAIYLDYEGELSGGRGRVRRIDRGPALMRERDGTIELRLDGRLLQGEYRIHASAAAGVVLDRYPSNPIDTT